MNHRVRQIFLFSLFELQLWQLLISIDILIVRGLVSQHEVASLSLKCLI